MPQSFSLSVSYTTRNMRPGDIHGVDYYFITNEEFDRMKENGEFLETARYVNNQYGTAKKEIESIRSQNKVPILDIEIQGYKQILETDLQVKSMFITVEDFEDLRERLIKRNTDSPEVINKRMDQAKSDMAEYASHKFDYILVNDHLDVSYENFKRKILEWFPHVEEKI